MLWTSTCLLLHSSFEASTSDFVHFFGAFIVLPLLQTNKLKELNFKNNLAPMCSKYYARTQCYGRQPACFCIHHLRLQRQILCIFLVHLAQNFFLFFHIQSVPGNGFTPCKRLFMYLPKYVPKLADSGFFKTFSIKVA